MAQTKLKFSEKNTFSEELGVKDSQFESANFEARETLPLDVYFVAVPQANATAEYTIENQTRTGARFWLAKIDDAGSPVEARTVSAGSLMGLFVKVVNDPEETLPTFPTKTTRNGLRADCDYIRAMPDTSFIKGREINGVKRLIIERPVKFKVTRRGNVASIAYEEELNASGHHDCQTDASGKAVCQLQRNVYTFSAPEDVAAKVAAKVTEALNNIGDSHFYAL